MKVLLYTIEMVQGVERLMPWKTLVEVAKFAPKEIDIAICSAQVPENEREYDGVKIYSIDYGITALCRFVAEGEWNVVYYPIANRQGLKNMDVLSSMQARMIAYVPGGLYPLSGSFKLIRMGEVRRALPYLLDTIVPHKIIAKKLQEVRFEAIICQAPLTSTDAIRSGWEKVVTALPGNISIANSDSLDESHYEKLGLRGQKFILFSGAPAPTRGAVLAMRAFDQIADRVQDTKMVMLMRRDVSSDFTGFEKAVSGIKHKDRFVINYDKITPDQLHYFFKNAWAVMLPFLIVPSEIPLTYFEVMQFGIPVVTFENGGTTDYLKKGLKIAKHRTIDSLAEAIVEICKNAEERNRLSENARKIMSKHPTWEETSKEWLSVL